MIDCSDYPDKDRLRFNCLLNAERMPPPPDVDNDAELLDDSLQLVYDEDDYELVFREEFESTSGRSHCENLEELRPSVWSIGTLSCGIQDANGNHCDGVVDGAYLMSISTKCRPRNGLKTGGKFAFRYGYFETKFTMRFQDYAKYTNTNLVLGDTKTSRKYWLHDYGVEIDSAESQLTNLAHEVDFFECVDTEGFCIWHSYFNIGGYVRREGTTLEDGYSTASAIAFCYGRYGRPVRLGDLCTEPYDFDVTVTIGIEWTPRGYRRSYKAEESGLSFIIASKPWTAVQRWVDGSRRTLSGEERDAFFEELTENDATSILEQVGVAHVPMHIEIGTWHYGFTDAQDTNDVKIEIDYIRLYQPENGYADMEPVYQ